VFVGFGALIAVRSGGASDAHQVSEIRWVVSAAIWVVIAALSPVIVSRYGITGHQLWLVCSLLSVVIFAVMLTVNGRAPENRADTAAILAAAPRVWLVAGAVLTFWLPTASLVLALALVVLGLFPDQEQALYLTAVGLGLFTGAIELLVLVFWHGFPSVPPDRGGLPASGGSST